MTSSDLAEIRVTLWVLHIEEPSVADLRTFDVIAGCGLEPHSLIDDDHGYCQRLALELRDAGYTGVAAPCAALPGAINVTLFGPRYELADIRATNRRIGSYVKVENLATTSPSGDVLPWVRRTGQVHQEYERWLSRNR